jgi:uncharacterized protein YbjQ (UPF0145 family)
MIPVSLREYKIGRCSSLLLIIFDGLLLGYWKATAFPRANPRQYIHPFSFVSFQRQSHLDFSVRSWMVEKEMLSYRSGALSGWDSASRQGSSLAKQSKSRKERDMIVTTTPSVEGRSIEGYLGVVNGEAILGAHFGRDLAAGLTDFFGGRSGAYEQEVQKARKIALKEMEGEATALGADAVVGVDVDYEVIRQGMLMVSVSGTAVKLS